MMISPVERSASQFMMASGLYYALLARQRVILCDGGQKGFEESAQAVVDGLQPSINMISYESSNHIFHIMVSNDLTYVCVSDKLFDRQIAFGFLRELERQLQATGLREKASYVGPYALRQEFGSVINAQLKQYSSGDKLSHLQGRVTEVTGVMTENIEKVVRRGEALEDLTDRSELLAHSSTDFRHSSTKLRKKLFWKSIKMWVIFVCVLLGIVLAIIIIIVVSLAATGHFNNGSKK